jgi:DNA-binding MarR family transcriptional regulator
MSMNWQTNRRTKGPTAATFLPPATVEETAWDILLMLHSDPQSELGLAKLARLVSTRQQNLNRWLALLERRGLITGATQNATQEVRAVLTLAGRQLLNRYLSATSDLKVGAHH